MSEASDNKKPQKSTIPFDREKWPFYWMTKANGLYLATLEKSLKDSDLDIPSWRALMLLDGDDARSISFLAKESIIKLSTMTRIIQRMEKDELVIVRQRARDARVTEALLTPKGREARKVAWALAEDVMEKAFEGISTSDLQDLMKILMRVTANF